MDVLKFDGSLPVGEAVILTKQLPHTSRTIACVQGGIEYWGWTIDRHLMTSLLDAINVNTYAFVQANTKSNVQEPTPQARPGDEEKKRQAKLNNPFAQIVNQQMKKLENQ
jgi:hypothetical protein